MLATAAAADGVVDVDGAGEEGVWGVALEPAGNDNTNFEARTFLVM